MNEELFRNVPPEIIIDILSRLPVRNILRSRCVCKPWLALIGTPEFAKSHLSKSVPGLLVYSYGTGSDLFKIFDFEEELEHHEEELHYSRIIKSYGGSLFSPAQAHPDVRIGSSANGLLFFRDISITPKRPLYVCNLITRESIHVPSLEWTIQYPISVTYGFGVSKISGEYKVVGIHCGRIHDPRDRSLPRIPKWECWIYTLGTAAWRSIPHCDTFENTDVSDGVFLNGNLHWLVGDLKGSCLISCLNLETENFSSFTTPRDGERGHFMGLIVVLGDCLCLCDYTSDDELVIWVMREYGVETSWTQEFVLSNIPDLACESLYPLKVFRDGDILTWSWIEDELMYYSNKTKTTMKLGMFQLKPISNTALLHTLSFVSLKDFVLENVTSFRVYRHSEQ